MTYDTLLSGEINHELNLIASGFDVHFGQVESPVERAELSTAVRSTVQIFESPTYQVQVVDRVGASDSFDARFIVGFLNVWPLLDNLRLATAFSTRSSRLTGVMQAKADLADTLAFLERA